MVMEDQLALKGFECWLYSQEELSLQMGDDVVLELFSFNYNQNGAKYAFKDTFLKYFEKEEFMLWKVKTNLQDLIDGRESRDRIISEFYDLGYDALPFLQEIGYYMYQLEDSEYTARKEAQIMIELKKDARALLQEIEIAEMQNRGFNIYNFKRTT